MKTEINITFTVELTPAEFNLISSALRGTLSPSKNLDAVNLQNQMQRQRLTQFDQYAKSMDKLRENLKNSPSSDSQ
jgi:cell shape-determining protein MreC